MAFVISLNKYTANTAAPVAAKLILSALLRFPVKSA